MSIGKNIRNLRKKVGFTQKQLAEKVGVNEVTIRSYEAEKYNPKMNTLTKLCVVLDCKITDLIDEDSKKYYRMFDRETNNDYDHSYSYASSEDELDKLLERRQNKDNEHTQKQHTIVIDTKVDETHPINIILKKHENGEQLTPEESELLQEHVQKGTRDLADAVRKLKIRLEETFSKYYAQLNEAGQKEADKQIQEAIGRATQQAKEQAEAQIILLTKIPEYQKQPISKPNPSPLNQ